MIDRIFTIIREDGTVIFIPDSCKNYFPDMARPTGIRNSRGKLLYRCNGFNSIDGKPGCANCYNHQNSDGSFVHHAERVRNGIADFEM